MKLEIEGTYNRSDGTVSISVGGEHIIELEAWGDPYKVSDEQAVTWTVANLLRKLVDDE